MKKTIQYLSATIVACIAFFACSDPYDDQFVAEPTIYEQQPLQDVDFSATILTDPLIITEENIGGNIRLYTYHPSYIGRQQCHGSIQRFVIGYRRL